MTVEVSVVVNGERVEATVNERLLLADFLRDELGLTGTNTGCEHGVCGTCTVLVDGHSVRSCLMFAVQADDAAVTTVEGLSAAVDDDALHPMQQVFTEHHALQCGFCTPGMMLSAIDVVAKYPDADEGTLREQLSGNICRCTGYHNIVAAVQQAAVELRTPQ